MVKHISILYRPANMTHREFLKYWKEVHTQLVKSRLPGLRKYVGNFPVQPPDAADKQPGSGQQLQCDGIVELHFDDLDSLRRAMSSPGWLSEERKKSSATMMDFSRQQFVVAEEVVIPLGA